MYFTPKNVAFDEREHLHLGGSVVQDLDDINRRNVVTGLARQKSVIVYILIVVLKSYSVFPIV